MPLKKEKQPSLFDKIEEYLLKIEKKYRGNKLLYIIGQDIWDILRFNGEYYQEEMKRKYSFENGSELVLFCEDGITRTYEYYVDEASNIDNGYEYDQQIRVFVYQEMKDLSKFVIKERMKGISND